MALRDPRAPQGIWNPRGQRESTGLGNPWAPQGVGTPGKERIPNLSTEWDTQGGHRHPRHFPRDRSPPCHPKGHRTPRHRAPRPSRCPQPRTCGEEVLGGPLGLGGLHAGRGRLGAGQGGVGQSQDPQGGRGEELQRCLGVHLGRGRGMSQAGDGGVRARGRRGQGDRGGGMSHRPLESSLRQRPQNRGEGTRDTAGGGQQGCSVCGGVGMDWGPPQISPACR